MVLIIIIFAIIGISYYSKKNSHSNKSHSQRVSLRNFFTRAAAVVAVSLLAGCWSIGDRSDASQTFAPTDSIDERIQRVEDGLIRDGYLLLRLGGKPGK